MMGRRFFAQFLRVILLISGSGCYFGTLWANISFASKESKITVAGGNVVFQNAISGWNGTLNIQSGSVSGNPITFNQGLYTTPQGAAQLTGQFSPAGLNPITLTSGQRIIGSPGITLGPLNVIGTGNVLSGQPDLIGTTTLLNSFAELQLNVQNRLGKSILLNNGQLTLLDDLTLGDDVTFTGSGRVNLNKRSLKMPAKDSAWSSTIYFNNATDITLNAKTSLSGTWTFGGGNGVLNGNGNILDLTSGGTLWIASGQDLELTDIIVRGIGDIYGSIVFEDATSRLRLSNATLQLASNYTMTTGGVYAEGQGSTIITGTNVLSITTNASFTVDRITFLADSLDSTPTVNISPNVPDNLRLIYLNHGQIKAAGDTGNSALAIANSNAIVGWVRDTSNAVNGLLVATSNVAAGLVVANSNAINGLLVSTSNAVAGLLVATSNVAAGLVVANSNAINGLLVSTSNAVAGLLVATSNVAAGLVVANSYAIVSAKQLAIDDSNALVSWGVGTSNAVNGLLVATSNAVAGLLVATSNVAAGLVVANSYAIVAAKQLAVDNSTAITGWVRDTSNAVAGLLVAVSYATVASGGNALAVDNSNAIVGWVRDTSNAVAGLLVAVSYATVASGGNALAVDNSNAIVGWVRDTSNAVNGLLVATSNAVAGLLVATSNVAAGLVVANSYAIVAVNNLAVANSTAITGWVRDTSNAVNGLLVATSNAVAGLLVETSNVAAGLVVANSYAIVSAKQLAIDDSTAITGWIRNTSNAVAGLMVDMSNSIVTINTLNVANSNAITGWIQNTSNAVAGLMVDMSNSIVTINTLNVANSNAIAGWIQNTSNAVAGLMVDMSNSIVTINTLNVANSNAITGWIKDTSNSVNAGGGGQLAIDNSNAIVGWIKDTSNAMAGLVVAMSDAIVAGGGNALAVDNSNAIIGWIRDTSNSVAGLLVDTSNAVAGLLVDTSNGLVALRDLTTSDTTLYLLGGGATASVIMDQSIFMNPNDVITLAGDLTLDGSGATIYYCNAFRSQFVIKPGLTVHLKNIVFSHLNEKTFNIAPNSQLIIDENVFFEMSTDMTFSQGLITLGSELNTLFVRGYGGIKKLTFAPQSISQALIFDLTSNTLALQDVELEGLEFMSHSSTVIDSQTIVGAVACRGDVAIDVNKNTDMNFVVEGRNNIFKLKKNSLLFNGSVLYGNQPLNELAIQFTLDTVITDPFRVLFGDNFLYLFSPMGYATVTFNDFFVNIVNQGSNSFVMDERAALFGQNLFIQTFPIKVLSASFELGSQLIVATDQANAIDTSFIRSIERLQMMLDRPTTAYLLRDFERSQELE